MAILILSDIHGNLDALDAVLADAQGRYDRILCLGDLVGYGAEPNEIVEWARANCEVIVRGNHDKACTGLDSADEFSPVAQASVEWTAKALTADVAEYLRTLPRGPVPIASQRNGKSNLAFDLVHGSPLDEDEYLIFPGDVEPLRDYIDSHLTFFGHTHVQGGFLLAGKGRRGGVKQLPPEGTLAIENDYTYLVNPGSVGQPRDRDPRAAYCIYALEERTVEYRRVDYDIESAARKIVSAGLPEMLAMRLYAGA